MNGTISHTLIRDSKGGMDHYQCLVDWSCDIEGIEHDSERWEPTVDSVEVYGWARLKMEDEPRLKGCSTGHSVDTIFGDDARQVLKDDESERRTLMRKIRKEIEQRLPDESEAPFREVGLK